MDEMRYLLLRVRTGGEYSSYCTLGEVAYRVGVHPELVEKFIHLGLIEIAEQTGEGEILFDAGAIPLVRRILRLRNQLGVNYAGIGVILELMAQIEALESHVAELESMLTKR